MKPHGSHFLCVWDPPSAPEVLGFSAQGTEGPSGTKSRPVRPEEKPEWRKQGTDGVERGLSHRRTEVGGPLKRTLKPHGNNPLCTWDQSRDPDGPFWTKVPPVGWRSWRGTFGPVDRGRYPQRTGKPHGSHPLCAWVEPSVHEVLVGTIPCPRRPFRDWRPPRGVGGETGTTTKGSGRSWCGTFEPTDRDRGLPERRNPTEVTPSVCEDHPRSLRYGGHPTPVTDDLYGTVSRPVG